MPLPRLGWVGGSASIDDAVLPKPARSELPHVNHRPHGIQPGDQRQLTVTHEPLHKGATHNDPRRAVPTSHPGTLREAPLRR